MYSFIACNFVKIFKCNKWCPCKNFINIIEKKDRNIILKYYDKNNKKYKLNNYCLFEEESWETKNEKKLYNRIMY